MKIEEIYKILNDISPFELQAKWDNSGLNIGDMQRSFCNIYVSLEIDWQVIESVKEDSLIIVHHPIIFKPIQNFKTDTYPCNLILECIRKNISVISMHTNFDLTHLNRHFADRLKLEAIGFIYNRVQDFSLIYNHKDNKHIDIETLAKHIKKALNIKQIRYSKGSDYLSSLFITSGSNADSYAIAYENCCIITGDIKYHDAMIANSQKISFIDVSHFDSECIFSNLLIQNLKNKNIQAIISSSHNPFCYLGEGYE